MSKPYKFDMKSVNNMKWCINLAMKHMDGQLIDHLYGQIKMILENKNIILSEDVRQAYIELLLLLKT